MPATARRKASISLLGVDGCRPGWIAVALTLSERAVSVVYAPDFATLLTDRSATAALIIVDMPIGLAERGPRACERAARAALGARRSSVFSAPRRPMLAFSDYRSANEWGKAQGPDGGGGLSVQAWNITPKIRELDRAIEPALQSRIGEGHPELAFARLNGGAPCAFPKRSREGRAERARLLMNAGLADPMRIVADAIAVSRGAACADDALDAAALALTAEARLNGRAMRLSDDARDARGLVMEIWG